MTHSHLKNRWLRTGIAAIAAAGMLTMSACSGTDSSGPDPEAAAEASYGSIDVPLSWLHTAEFAGLYMAIDNGYYEEAGFESVNLVPGGPSATPSTIQVATGKGLVGWSNPLLVGSAIAEEGDAAPLKIIGSVFQQIPYTFITMADNPATAPEDLIGMKIGTPPTNEPVLNAVLEANDLVGKVEIVSIQSDPQPFLQGDVDAIMGFATNELISIREQGYDVVSMPITEIGLPMSGGSLIATEEAIEENREEIKAFLVASIRGWQAALADDEEAARTTVEVHAADQNLGFQHQLVTAQLQSDLISTPWTQEHGLFTMSQEAIDGTLASIALVGYAAPADLFDFSLLEEVYAEHPELLAY